MSTVKIEMLDFIDKEVLLVGIGKLTATFS
jgi:hypothetical protein